MSQKVPAEKAPPATYSLRSDPELEAAFDKLGVEPGTRSAIIKRAVLALADAEPSALWPVDAQIYRRDTANGAEYVLRLPGATV